MTELTKQQQLVFEAAKARLSTEKWFSGVCCDDFPSDFECTYNFEDSVSCVCQQTAMWDDPNFWDIE